MISQQKPRATGAIGILTAFMLLHQADRFLVAPLTTPIMETFGIGEDLMGLTATAAIAVSIALLPLWGYFGDRLSRPYVIAAASSIWGVTTAASAMAPSYRYFLVARASTGIDDGAYPAVRSLVADYVSPGKRALAYGVLSATAPLGYLLAVVLALALRKQLGWRGLYLLTGAAGILVAIVIAVRLREIRRGAADALALGVHQQKGQVARELPTDPDPVNQFSWAEVGKLVRRPTFLILVAQGFFGVFPWNVIAFWFFRYLEVERRLSELAILTVMTTAILAMSAGNLIGGWIGDAADSRVPAGRIAVSMTAVLSGSALLWATLSVPHEKLVLFVWMTALTAFVIPIAGPNVLATLMEICPPEIRSTASAVQSFMEGSGASFAPLVAGVVAVRSSLETAIGVVSIVAWLVCGLLFGLAFFTLAKDRQAVREQLLARLE
ncbi:MAG: MFS transporter [Acidimicrobiia bacterium]